MSSSCYVVLCTTYDGYSLKTLIFKNKPSAELVREIQAKISPAAKHFNMEMHQSLFIENE